MQRNIAMRGMAGLLAMVWLVACTDKLGGLEPGDDDLVQAVFEVRDGGFWAAPFPSDHRVLRDSRKPDLSGWPVPAGADALTELVALLHDGTKGWSSEPTIYVPFDGAIDPASLPDPTTSTKPESTVYLIDVEPESENAGQRVPILVSAREDTSGAGPAHAIVARVLPGRTLRPRTRYALVVARPVLSVDGRELGTPVVIDDLIQNRRPEGWFEDVAQQYIGALDVLRDKSVDLRGIVGISVFTTDQPGREQLVDDLALLRQRCSIFDQQNPCMNALGAPLPNPEGWPRVGAFLVTDQNDDFCTYETTIYTQFYVKGSPPFAEEGDGVLERSALGELVNTHNNYATSTAQPDVASGRLIVTLPTTAKARSAMPSAIVLQSGAEGRRPLVDRGVRTEAGVDRTPGEGIARELARAGIIGVQFDSPFTDPRLIGAPEDPRALLLGSMRPDLLRAGIAQWAYEIAMLPTFLRRVPLDPMGCPAIHASSSADGITFDVNHMMVVADDFAVVPAVVAAGLAPENYRAIVASGGFATWADRIAGTAASQDFGADQFAAKLGVSSGQGLSADHPALALWTWALESVSPALWGARFTREPPYGHVAVFQGVVDPVGGQAAANGLAVALNVDLAGEALETSAPKVLNWLALQGGQQRELPAGGNRSSEFSTDRFSQLLVQLPADGVENAHEAFFQTPAARWQFQCFAGAWARGVTPAVADLERALQACPELQ